MRTTFSNDMVAHVWAQQNQDYGRSGNGQFYFHGPTLYSYGPHYVVGHFAEPGIVLINASGYSISTARHTSLARGATYHLNQLSVPDLTSVVGWLKNKRAIEDHIRNYAKEISEESALYLLKSCGTRNPATALNRIKREAERKANKRAAEIAKNRKANDLQEARTIANMSDAQLAEWIDKLASDWNGIAALERTSKRLLRVQRAAKAAHQAKRAAAVSNARKIVRARLALEQSRVERKKVNEYLHTCIRILRFNAKLYREAPTDNRLASSYFFQQWANAASFVLKHAKGLTTYGRATLEKVRSDADARYEELRAQEIERNRVETERRARERFEQETERRERWLAGDSVYWHGSDEKGGAMLRVVENTLQTSHGASVPLDHAIKVFRFLKRVKESGRTWHRNGETMRVGHFQVDRVELDGSFKAGCHTIHWAEVERIARQLDVLDLPPL